MNEPSRFVPALIALAVVGTWAILNPPAPLLFAGPVVLLLGRRVMPPAPTSPVWIIVFFLSLVGAAGFAMYGGDTGESGFLYRLTETTAKQTVMIFAGTSFFIALGAVAYGLCRPRLVARLEFSAEDFSPRATTLIKVVGYGPLVLGLLLASPLYQRAEYLGTAEISQLAGLLGTITLAGVCALGFLIRSEEGGRRVLPVIAAVLSAIILFSLGSRRFALIPLGLAFGAFMAKPDKSGRNVLFASAFVSFLLVPIPLYLRGLPTHGLANYLPALETMPYGLSEMRQTIVNLTQGFPVTGLTALTANPIDPEAIAISVTPAPGGLAGWTEISDQLRLGAYFPYSGIGEAWNVSSILAIGLFFVVGIAFGHLDYRSRQLITGGRRIVALAIIGLTLLSGILLSQYNLRNATRPIWYALAVDLVSRVQISGVRDGRQASKNGRARRLRN